MGMLCDLAPISVVITTFNDLDYLGQAIESVLEQDLVPRQIIVVDDGSHQMGAEGIVDKYACNDKSVHVTYFRKDNGGASSARNLGIRESSFRYVAFLDVDDQMLPSNLSEKYNLISSLDDGYFGVYGGALRSTGEEEVFADIDGVVGVEIIDCQVKGIPGGAPFYLFSKDALISVGGFDESLKCNEDHDLIIRLLKSSKKCKGSTGIGFYRNIRIGSLSRPVDPFKKFGCVMLFLDKAERNEYYESGILGYKRMDAYLALARELFVKRRVVQAFKFSRMAFKHSKPVTVLQKSVYFFSFSFLVN
tara:strand:+ start:2023 stop:2937 length:915 start_codon:yes stop_codon:yes gene_type:complete